MDDLIKRANDAIQGVTPGPWPVGMVLGDCVFMAGDIIYTSATGADARFIAAARGLVPEMAAEIMILRHELAALSARLAAKDD